MEVLEPSGGGDGIAYGVIGYAGPANVAIYQDTFGNFATSTLLANATAQSVNGVGFFITALSQSACDVPAAELNTASSNYAAEHNLAFSTSHCGNGQLVPISDSQGIWQLPTSGFPDKFQSLNGGEGSNSTPTLPVAVPDSHKVASVLLNRYRILRTRRVPAAALPSNALLLRVAGPRLGLDTSDVAEVQPTSGVKMWLVPGSDGICGFERDRGGGSGSCGRIHGGLGPGTTGSYPGGAMAEGFAPDGVNAVAVALADGRKLSVPVKDNTYFIRVRGTQITNVSPQ